jgi:NAD(P)-dependent dehydrogenase (short-subunit alcohol dehydrogenase family)
MSDNTGFGPRSTAAEVINGVDLTGRRAVVTGGASGIGVETARALAGAGAEVVLAVRDVDAGLRVAADIKAERGVTVKPLDLADQGSVAAFVADWRGPLHILVNNAGVTNHLGHFALTVGLHDALADEGARVVSVSSGAHRNSPIHFEDIHFHSRAYEPWSAYAQSKTANVLFAVDVSARWGGEGILANAVMPGRISTNLQRHLDPEELRGLQAASDIPADEYYKTPEQGAATSVLLAASPLLEGIGGRYFEDCHEAEVTGPGAKHGVAAHALDPVAAARLWQVSLDTLARR